MKELTQYFEKHNMDSRYLAQQQIGHYVQSTTIAHRALSNAHVNDWKLQLCGLISYTAEDKAEILFKQRLYN